MGQPTTRPADPRRSGRRSIGSSGPLIATVEWLRKAVGSPDATIQLLLPGADDRLYVLASSGEPVLGGRRRSGRRREVLATGRPARIALARPAGSAIAIHPLVADGRTMGVVEIVAPTADLDARREVVDAVVGEAAIVVRSLRDERASESALRTAAADLRLATELLRADSPASAVSATVRHCFDRLRSPVAGLLPDRSGTGWFVAAAHGLGPSKRAELRRSLDEVSVTTRADRLGPQLAERFAAALGSRDVRAVEAGDAFLVIADDPGAPDASIDAVASLLGEALERVGSAGRARVRDEELDMALAWTAHELRGPLVGARAALDRVKVSDEDAEGRELLRRTLDELQRLTDLVDPLLRWSVRPGSLRMRRTDLARVVGEAVASCRLGSAERIVIVDAPPDVVVRADEQELRAAIANVVRNAIDYSPPDAAVTVVVDANDDVARVRVRDRGPGVPASERHLIFDPFVRGTAGGARHGNGLGLFIARRVVEAHGGAIGLRPVRTGAEFCIELPLVGAREKEGSLSAS